MKIDPKLKFLVVIGASLLHIYRDHLQIRGVHNKFTDFGHEINSPKHEKDGIFILGLIAAFALYFYERDEEKELGLIE